MDNKPQLIVLTPVRNEAWVLRAFLAATSLWADKIIIADQMSTDGSRDIYREFVERVMMSVERGVEGHQCELIVIDNDRKEMHQAATRRLLLDKACEILNGDTNAILFALDADEFLSGDFVHTEDWQKIMNSEPNDVFCWRWQNLKGGDLSLYERSPYYYWAVHVSDTIWNGQYPDSFIHEMRFPWPKDFTNEYCLEGMFSIHFAHANIARQTNKERFYQVSSLATKSEWNTLSIYRMYHKGVSVVWQETPEDIYTFYDANGVQLLAMIDLKNEDSIHTNEIKRIFADDGLEKYRLLDIWDEEWCEQNGFVNPQKWYDKLFLRYLHWSGMHRNLLTRGVDWIIKRIV